jgi:hypothetical protein
VEDERTHKQEAAMNTLLILAFFITRLLIPIALLIGAGTLLSRAAAR